MRPGPHRSPNYPEHRIAKQLARDRQEVREQRSWLLDHAAGSRLRDLELLVRRREGNPDVVVPEIVGSGENAGLVVGGEVMVPWHGMDAALELVRRFDPGCHAMEVPWFGGSGLLRFRPGALAVADVLAQLAGREHVFGSASGVLQVCNLIKRLPPPRTTSSLPPAPPPGPHPSNITVAVIDTGIDQAVRADGWLVEVARDQHNIDPLDDFPNGGDGFLDLAAGHGTFLAGLIRRVSPAAEIRAYRAADSDGLGSEIGVAEAIIGAVKEGADVLLVGLSCTTVDDLPPTALRAALTYVAMNRPDVVLVAPAGNAGDSRRTWPAALSEELPSVVAVAAVDAMGDPAPWSSHGPWVTCSATGEGVVGPVVSGMPYPDLDPFPDQSAGSAFAIGSGTSIAAAQVAGVVAQLSSETAMLPRSALAEILASGTTMVDHGSVLRLLPGT